MRTAPLINVALEAAASGQLVIGGFPGARHDRGGRSHHQSLSAGEPPSGAAGAWRRTCADRGAGAAAQDRRRTAAPPAKSSLNTPAVAGIIAEGRTSQLPAAIEGGRTAGMLPLNDALAAFVQSGAVDVREAYRRAADRAGFLALLKRLGMDTTPIERMA